MLNAFLPTEYIGRAKQRIATGAQRTQRSLDDVDISGAVVVSLDSNSAMAKNRARAFIAMYFVAVS